jgi:hypothetical protein
MPKHVERQRVIPGRFYGVLPELVAEAVPIPLLAFAVRKDERASRRASE